jgi:hypothetical protein
VETGKFYFLKEQYFIDFPDPKLEKNKEVMDGVLRSRPCFYAFKNEKNDIYWMIPISSKVDKYRREYDKKIKRFGICDTIVLGDILGQERAFLIQDMCPTISEYIEEEYAYSFFSHIPVRIEPYLKIDIEEKAKNVLGLTRRGNTYLVFPKILEIEKQLLRKLGGE